MEFVFVFEVNGDGERRADSVECNEVVGGEPVVELEGAEEGLDFALPELVVFVVGVLGGGGGEALDCRDLLLEGLLAGVKDLGLEAGCGCVVDAGEDGGDEAGLFGKIIDMNAEIVSDCGLFVNLGLKRGEDGRVNMWLRHFV